MRDIECHTHNDTTDQSSSGDSQDPTKKDFTQLLPVDALEITVHLDRVSSESCIDKKGAERKTRAWMPQSFR